MPKRTVFKNANGSDYFIVAGTDELALLREVSLGSYVIVWGLDWVNMSWGGGSYFAADEFQKAVKAFLGREDEES